jgi:hypothetical protein
MAVALEAVWITGDLVPLSHVSFQVNAGNGFQICCFALGGSRLPCGCNQSGCRESRGDQDEASHH